MKTRKCLLCVFMTVMAAGDLCAITATKEYVDKQAKAASAALVATNNALVTAIGKVEKDASVALVATNNALVTAIGKKVDVENVYKKTETYSSTEIDSKLAGVDVKEVDPVFSLWKTNETKISIGSGANASGADGVAIGKASGAYIDSVAIGYQAKANKKGSIKIGYNSDTASQAYDYAVAIGYGSTATANNGISIGKSAAVNGGVGAIAIGASAKAYKQEGIAIGASAAVNAQDGIAVNGSVLSGHDGAVVFGGYSQGANTFSIEAADPSMFYFNAIDKAGIGSKTLQSYFDGKLDVGDFTDVTNDVAALKVWALGNSFMCVVTNLVMNDAAELSWDDLPSLAYSYKTTGGEMKEAWNELTRWNVFLTDYEKQTNAVNAALDWKADRAWGHYDSHSGEYAPDGYTWISSPSIAVAGGLAWEKHIASDSAIWVLTANGMSVQTAGNTNGVFTISDGGGNVMISIVKGDEQIVGAYQDGIDSTNVDGVVHWYISTVISDAADASAAPSLKCARTCWDNPTWYSDDDADNPWSVTWSNASGRWVAEVVAKGTEKQGFFQTYYKRGAKSKIRNEVPTELAGGLIIGGVEYEVGTAVIDAKTVLTLSKK